MRRIARASSRSMSAILPLWALWKRPVARLDEAAGRGEGRDGLTGTQGRGGGGVVAAARIAGRAAAGRPAAGAAADGRCDARRPVRRQGTAARDGPGGGLHRAAGRPGTGASARAARADRRLLRRRLVGGGSAVGDRTVPALGEGPPTAACASSGQGSLTSLPVPRTRH